MKIIFFFQAEDGIRDGTVTGVQTCALPILIAPPALVPAFAAARAVADWHSPAVEQAVLADFIREGHFARHIRRMRVLYLARRNALLAALEGLEGLGPNGFEGAD